MSFSVRVECIFIFTKILIYFSSFDQLFSWQSGKMRTQILLYFPENLR
jgi:hypothetical protein